MKKLYFFLLAALIGSTFKASSQESHPKLSLYPLAYTLQDYTEHTGANGGSLFTLFYPKKNGRIAICNFNAISIEQDKPNESWYESLVGLTYSIHNQHFQTGFMVGMEKRIDFEFKVSPWVYLKSKNERWSFFGAYEQGPKEWSIRLEGSFLLKEWEERDLELEIGMISHEFRVGADAEVVYKSFNLYVAPVMLDTRTGNLGGMLGIGRKFGPGKSFPSHRSKGVNHEIHHS